MWKVDFCVLCKLNFYLNNFFWKLHRDATGLTSLHLTPALLDTYTLGLLARFFPTDPVQKIAEREKKRQRESERAWVGSQYLHCIWCHISQASITTDIMWPSDKTTAFKTTVKGVFMFHDVNHMRDLKCIQPHHICSVDANVSAYSNSRPQ